MAELYQVLPSTNMGRNQVYSPLLICALRCYRTMLRKRAAAQAIAIHLATKLKIMVGAFLQKKVKKSLLEQA
jgi:hypothetical protein